jgi:hypothetical protein
MGIGRFTEQVNLEELAQELMSWILNSTLSNLTKQLLLTSNQKLMVITNKEIKKERNKNP